MIYGYETLYPLDKGWNITFTYTLCVRSVPAVHTIHYTGSFLMSSSTMFVPRYLTTPSLSVFLLSLVFMYDYLFTEVVVSSLFIFESLLLTKRVHWSEFPYHHLCQHKITLGVFFTVLSDTSVCRHFHSRLDPTYSLPNRFLWKVDPGVIRYLTRPIPSNGK